MRRVTFEIITFRPMYHSEPMFYLKSKEGFLSRMAALEALGELHRLQEENKELKEELGTFMCQEQRLFALLHDIYNALKARKPQNEIANMMDRALGGKPNA